MEKLFVRKGKKQYPIKQGDYLFDNGACVMFVPKDKNILPFDGWHYPSHMRISQEEFNRLVLSCQFKKVIKENMTYYFFKDIGL